MDVVTLYDGSHITEELLETLREIKIECVQTPCKKCPFYVSGRIVEHCLFDDMPREWNLRKLKEVQNETH